MRTRIAREQQRSNDLRSKDRGASAVEYGLLVSAIAAVIVGIVFALGGIVAETFQQTEECITLVANGPNCSPDSEP